MRKSYSMAKGRRSTGAFLKFPKAVWESENFVNLAPCATALLIDIAMQFNGKNNGDLLATHSFLKKRGWKSKTTIRKYLDELEHYGLVVCIQRGGINCGLKQRPSLFALGWLPIDKVCYSDGYQPEKRWKIKEIPGTWKIPKPPLCTPKKKRLPPLVNRKISGPIYVPH